MPTLDVLLPIGKTIEPRGLTRQGIIPGKRKSNTDKVKLLLLPFLCCITWAINIKREARESRIFKSWLAFTGEASKRQENWIGDRISQPMPLAAETYRKVGNHWYGSLEQMGRDMWCIGRMISLNIMWDMSSIDVEDRIYGCRYLKQLKKPNTLYSLSTLSIYYSING